MANRRGTLDTIEFRFEILRTALSTRGPRTRWSSGVELWDTGRTVPRVADTAVPDADFQAASTMFSEKELVDLTIAID